MVSERAGDHSRGMNTTPPEASSGPEPGAASDPHQQPSIDGPRVGRQEVRGVGRIRRTVGPQRKVAGVAGGLARHLDVDPVLLRVGFVVLILFGGAGLLLYLAGWLLLPEEGSDRAAIHLDERSLLVALVGVLILSGLLLVGDSWNGLWFSWPLAVIGLIALVVIASRQSGGTPTGPPAPYAPPPGTPGTQPPGTQPPGTPPPGTPQPVPGSYATAYAAPGAPPAAPGYVPGGPGGPGGSYPPPGYTPPGPVVPPTRKRGPVLFWFTLALITLGLGILGMVDVAGAHIEPSAYPALATAIIAVMLLVGAFFGRPGGLILLGLVAATALVASTVAEHVETNPQTVRPTSAVAVADRYSHGAGDIVVDLTAVADLESLDGRTIRVESGAGRIVVIVPDTLDVVAETNIGAGSARVFGDERDGAGVEMRNHHDAVNEVASITLEVQLGLGEVEVRAASPTRVPALESN